MRPHLERSVGVIGRQGDVDAVRAVDVERVVAAPDCIAELDSVTAQQRAVIAAYVYDGSGDPAADRGDPGVELVNGLETHAACYEAADDGIPSPQTVIDHATIEQSFAACIEGRITAMAPALAGRVLVNYPDRSQATVAAELATALADVRSRTAPLCNLLGAAGMVGQNEPIWQAQCRVDAAAGWFKLVSPLLTPPKGG